MATWERLDCSSDADHEALAAATQAILNDLLLGPKGGKPGRQLGEQRGFAVLRPASGAALPELQQLVSLALRPLLDTLAACPPRDVGAGTQGRDSPGAPPAGCCSRDPGLVAGLLGRVSRTWLHAFWLTWRSA
jgi:hypothetical protein